MNKYGAVTDGDTQSDFDSTKKAEFYDREGSQVADEANKDKLSSPAPISEISTPKPA